MSLRLIHISALLCCLMAGAGHIHAQCVPSTVSGVVFSDLNSNGVNDGEPGISGVDVLIYQDANTNGVIDAGTDILMSIETTSATGNYNYTASGSSAPATEDFDPEGNVFTGAHSGTGWASDDWIRSGTNGNTFDVLAHDPTHPDDEFAGVVLELKDNDAGAYRLIDLSAATSATLTFQYDHVGLMNGDEELLVRIDPENDGTYVTIHTIVATNNSPNPAVDLSISIPSAHLGGGNTRIEFRTGANNLIHANNEAWWLDNVQLATDDNAVENYLITTDAASYPANSSITTQAVLAAAPVLPSCTVTARDFGLAAGACNTTSVSGMIYNDLNGNGSNNGEPGIAGVAVLIYHDVNANGILDAGVDILLSTETTNSGGGYSYTSSGVVIGVTEDFDPIANVFAGAHSGTNWTNDSWTRNGTNNTNDDVQALDPSDPDLELPGALLELKDNDAAAYRLVDLSSTTSATLTFDYDYEGLMDGGEELHIMIDPENDNSYITIHTITATTNSPNPPVTATIPIPVAQLGGANSRIEFRTGADNGINLNSEDWWIDNVHLSVDKNAVTDLLITTDPSSYPADHVVTSADVVAASLTDPQCSVLGVDQGLAWACSIGVDNDMDGISDNCDLDDDNDGIPDDIECPLISTTLGTGDPWLAINGADASDIQVNDVFIKDSFITLDGVPYDLRFELISEYSSDGTYSGTTWFDPGNDLLKTTGNIPSESDHVVYDLQIVVNGSVTAGDPAGTPLTTRSFSVLINDIDNSGSATDWTDIGGFLADPDQISYVGSQLGKYVLPNGTEAYGMVPIVADNAAGSEVEHHVRAEHAQRDHVRLLHGVHGSRITSAGNRGAGLRMYIGLCPDTDADGVADHLDLDSDNDGIYDLVEAGHAETDADNNGIIDGAISAFGNNGLFNGIETMVDNGVLNYTISDSDSDGDIDSIELDSDGDLCYDVLEAGYIDHNDDGELGDVPLTVDGNGLVTSGGP